VVAYYAAEARCYGLWFFVIGLTVIAWLRWYEALTTNGSAASAWTWALAWGLAGAGGLWLHLFHVFLLVGQASVVLVLLGADRQLAVRRPLVLGSAALAGALPAALAGALAVGLFVPWLVILSHREITGVGWTRSFSWANLAYCLFAAQFGSSLGPSVAEGHAAGAGTLFAQHPVSLSLAGAAMGGLVCLWAVLLFEACAPPRQRGGRVAP